MNDSRKTQTGTRTGQKPVTYDNKISLNPVKICSQVFCKLLFINNVTQFCQICKDRFPKLFAAVFVSDARLVLVSFPYNLGYSKLHRVLECAKGLIVHKPFSICLFYQARTALDLQRDGTYDQIVADSFCRYIYSTPAKIQPVITRLAVIVYTDSIPINPYSSSFIEEFFQPFFISNAKRKYLWITIKDVQIEMNRADITFHQFKINGRIKLKIHGLFIPPRFNFIHGCKRCKFVFIGKTPPKDIAFRSKKCVFQYAVHSQKTFEPVSVLSEYKLSFEFTSFIKRGANRCNSPGQIPYHSFGPCIPESGYFDPRSCSPACKNLW